MATKRNFGFRKSKRISRAIAIKAMIRFSWKNLMMLLIIAVKEIRKEYSTRVCPFSLRIGRTDS